MARAQYQGSARSSGYRPPQVDDRNLARKREESNRVIQGMRDVAQAEISNRERVARAMKENAAAESEQRQLNFQIQTQNSNNAIQGLQAKARRDEQQFVEDSQALESMFKSISTLSTKAGAKVEEIQKERKLKEFKRQFAERNEDGNKLTNSLRRKKDETDARIAAQSSLAGVQEAEEKGADKNLTSKIKSADPVTQYDYTEATVAKFWRFDYPGERDKRIAAAQEEKGQPLTADEIKAVVAQFRDEIYTLVGESGMSHEFVEPYVKYADESDAALYSRENEKERKVRDATRGETHLTILNNTDPAKRQEVFNSSWSHLVDVYGLPGAYDKLEKSVFNVQDPKTGKFYWTMEAIEQLKIPTLGKTFGEAYRDKNGNPTGRLAQMMSERIKLDVQFRKQQINIDNVAHAELEQQLFQAFNLNRTAANAAETQAMYLSVTGKPSTILNNAAKHLTYEAQHKKNVISAASKLRDFELTPTVVEGICSIDPEGCKPLKERSEAYHAKWSSDGYKGSEKALDKLVGGTNAFGMNKGASLGAMPMVAYLKAELRRRTAAYEKELGFEGARLRAGAEIEAEYKANYRNNERGNIYYRKVTRNGTVAYPYLNLDAPESITKANEVLEEINDLRDIATSGKGIDGAIAAYFEQNPDRVEYIQNNYNKPTFKPTPQELALKGMAPSMPMHTMFNRGFQKVGNPTVLQSPLQSNGKDVVLTPAQAAILGDPNLGINAKMATIQSVLNPASFREPSSMRAGSPIAAQIAPPIVNYTQPQRKFANTVYELAKKHGARHPEVAAAIASLETGFGKTQADNNVFNLRAVGGGFEKFATLEDAVKRYVQLWDKNHSGYKNLESFDDPNEAFAAIVNSYAPAADNNNPEAYKRFVSDFIKSQGYLLK